MEEKKKLTSVRQAQFPDPLQRLHKLTFLRSRQFQTLHHSQQEKGSQSVSPTSTHRKSEQNPAVQMSTAADTPHSTHMTACTSQQSPNPRNKRGEEKADTQEGQGRRNEYALPKNNITGRRLAECVNMSHNTPTRAKKENDKECSRQLPHSIMACFEDDPEGGIANVASPQSYSQACTSHRNPLTDTTRGTQWQWYS